MCRGSLFDAAVLPPVSVASYAVINFPHPPGICFPLNVLFSFHAAVSAVDSSIDILSLQRQKYTLLLLLLQVRIDLLLLWVSILFPRTITGIFFCVCFMFALASQYSPSTPPTPHAINPPPHYGTSRRLAAFWRPLSWHLFA